MAINKKMGTAVAVAAAALLSAGCSTDHNKAASAKNTPVVHTTVHAVKPMGTKVTHVIVESAHHDCKGEES